MRVVELGVLDDAEDIAGPHENNISPFFPHSEGYVQINCHGAVVQAVIVETSDDLSAWSTVKQIGYPVEANERSHTVAFYHMGRYIRVRGVNITGGSIECTLVGG